MKEILGYNIEVPFAAASLALQQTYLSVPIRPRILLIG
jgi:hypothetical protein